MMKPEDALKNIKVFLGMQNEELSSLELKEHTVFAKSFEVGSKVTFKKEDEDVPLPQGVYELKDGTKTLTIDENSQIVNMEEVAEDKKELEDEAGKNDYVTREEFMELVAIVQEIAKQLSGNEEMESLEAEMSKIKTNLSEVSSALKEAKEQISKIETPEIVHTPEPTNKQKTFMAATGLPISPGQRNIYKSFNNA